MIHLSWRVQQPHTFKVEGIRSSLGFMEYMFLPLLFLKQNAVLYKKMMTEQWILWLSSTEVGT